VSWDPVIPYAGMIRVRFEGYDLSPGYPGHPYKVLTAKIQKLSRKIFSV